MTRITSTDVSLAYATWRCTCGPAALAALLDLTLDEVRPYFDPFSGYTTPTKMFQALRNAKRVWRQRAIRDTATGSLPWPQHGLARIQWHGPWTTPGANQRWAYTQTHWVASSLLQPMAVSIRPDVSFGRPTLVGTGTRVDVVTDRHAAGDSIELLARDYHVDEHVISDAITWHRGEGDTMIWDVNQLDVLDGSGWAPLARWTYRTVPDLTRDIPRASGGWSITHCVEVER